MKKTIFASALVLALCGCSTAPASYKAGTYTAEAEGHNGIVKVEVTVSESAITNVKVTEHGETAGIADGALENLPAKIVEMNSADVDAVSGCTETSEAIINAVKEALKEAKG